MFYFCCTSISILLYFHSLSKLKSYIEHFLKIYSSMRIMKNLQYAKLKSCFTIAFLSNNYFTENYKQLLFLEINMENKFTILVVDDEPYMTEMLQSFFEMNNYVCFTATDGVEALEILKAEAIDIVITDIKMPKMNGLDLLKEIKGKHKGTSAVIMTGFSEEYTTSEALNSGADGYITKPFRNKELLLILRRIRQLSDNNES